jgi:hypothetical protein
MMIPDVIYLQWFDEDGEKDVEVTWCEDRINNTDLVYALASTVTAAPVDLADPNLIEAQPQVNPTARPEAETDTEILDELVKIASYPTDCDWGDEHWQLAVEATDGLWRGLIQAMDKRRSRPNPDSLEQSEPPPVDDA